MGQKDSGTISSTDWILVFHGFSYPNVCIQAVCVIARRLQCAAGQVTAWMGLVIMVFA
jgi:hypothetical protein